MLRNLHQTLSVEGASGQTYTLHQFSFDDFDDLKGAFPACGGIYVFTRVQSNLQTPIYCGKTDDFSTRFNNHHAETCIKRNYADRVSLMEVDTEKERTRIETDILENYNFACNIQHNS